jgi:hypothetical protein
MILGLFGCLLIGAFSARIAISSANPGAAKSRVRITCLLVLVAVLGMPRFLDSETNARLLNLLTPEGLIRATLVLAPVSAIASVALLRRTAV